MISLTTKIQMQHSLGAGAPSKGLPARQALHEQLEAGTTQFLCLGLQCIGFNQAVYEALLGQESEPLKKKRKLDELEDDDETLHHPSQEVVMRTEGGSDDEL